MRIKERGSIEDTTILMRCCMVRIAHIITEQRYNTCMITGEALSQVASQTPQSLRCTNDYTNYSIFRPLIGFDKEEIIKIANKIDTFETSILPFEDCCTIFSPKNPVVKPHFDHIKRSYEKLEIEDLLNKAIDEAEIIKIEEE